jgi:putative ABC transport system permease protein
MRSARSIAAPWVPGGIPLAWRQLMGDKKRFAVALGGISFGAILMLFQLGIYQAFMQMAVRPILAMKGELAMISSDFQYVMTTPKFPERRLYQALAMPEVKDVFPVMVLFGSWRNPETGRQCKVALFGVHAFANPFVLPEVVAQESVLALPDGALYDAASPREFGDVVGMLARDGEIRAEINEKSVRVLGTFRHGRTLAVNGHVVLGAQAFRRVTNRAGQTIEMGMIELREGADAADVARRLNERLPPDVRVLTRADLVRKEQQYWQVNSPLGFIVTAGMLIAMFVGSVIAYQILYTDINDHIQEYATLKALGLGRGFFLRLILQQAAILPAFGFLPGMLLAHGLFRVANEMSGIPTRLTLPDTLLVFGLTILACVAAGLLATRRLRAADPADVF